MPDSEELKLAKFLCVSFEMSFNRPWDDMPDNVKKSYCEAARDLIVYMSGDYFECPKCHDLWATADGCGACGEGPNG